MDATQPEHTTNAEVIAQLQQRRADLVAALTNLNAQLSLLVNMTLTDAQYEKKRADLINQKADIEQELPTLNSEIKAYNTLKAAADKRAADARRAAGSQTNLENLQRAVRKGHARPSELERARASTSTSAPETAVRDVLVAYVHGSEATRVTPMATVELAMIATARAAEFDEWAAKGLLVLVDLRPEVRAFAVAMEERLKANDWKGGWGDDSPDALLKRLGEEVVELRKEIRKPNAKKDPDQIRREVADVANFAMMIADVCGALTKK